MSTLELTIKPRGEDGYPVSVNLRRAGEFLPNHKDAMLVLDPSDYQGAHSLTDLRFDPYEYGLLLGKRLFRMPVDEIFTQTLAEGETLRILLSVDAPDLRQLHWHRLVAPFEDSWRFLAVDQRTPFSLDIPSPASARFPVIRPRDLRALLLVAGPESLRGAYRLTQFDVAATRDSLCHAFGDIPCDVLEPPTLDELCAVLTASRYSLLHIVCHGAVNESGETILFFPVGISGRPTLAGELISRLGNVRNMPHFIFLSACDSALPTVETGLDGLAQRLVRELSIPAVLAMTDKISIPTAGMVSSCYYSKLKAHGEADLALAEALAGLQGRPDLTVPALFSNLSGYSLFRDTLERSLSDREIDFGLTKLNEFLPERAPVCQAELDRLVSVPHDLAGQENTPTWQARLESLSAIDSLCFECLDLSFKLLCVGRQPPPYDGRSPFRGLESFRPEDKEFFFGRESLTTRLVEKLAEYPFLAVLGASGCGKSSLVMAGLVPALHLPYSVFRPGTDPSTELEKALLSDPALLIIDQFEELFTLLKPEDHQRRLDFLQALLKQSANRKLVLTLRADFLGEVSAYRPLKDLIEAHSVIIPPMNEQELHRAMDGQARQVGMRFEADLALQMLEDVAGEPGAMPLLQHALWSLWKRRHGRWLRADEYHAFGGVRQAIASTAEDLYTQCSDEERDQLQDIFLRLTRLDDDTPTGEHRDTRRRILLGDLAPAGSDPAATTLLVDKLADARLVVKSTVEVEVAHEALIRYWDRLKGWLNEDRDNLRLREGVSDDARRWGNASRDESLLNHRGARLELALVMSQMPRYHLNPVETDYLTACVILREREKAVVARRRRWTIVGISVALVLIMAILTGWGITSANNARELGFQVVTSTHAQGQAQQQASTAEAAKATAVSESNIRATAQADAELQARISRAGELAAQSAVQRGTKFDLSLLLGMEAFSTYDNHQSRSALLENLLTNPFLSQYLHPQPGGIIDIVFSPDDRLVAFSLYDNTIVLWDPNANRPAVEPLKAHWADITDFVFSPDGSLLASGSRDDTIILWDVKTGKPLGEPFTKPNNSVLSLAFSPDGRLLAAGDYEKTITLWDLSTRQPVGKPFAGSSMAVTRVDFSPDSKTLVSESWDGNIILWNIATRLPLGKPIKDSKYLSQGVIYSSNNRTISSGNWISTLTLQDVFTGKIVGSPITGPFDTITSIALSPDRKTLATSNYENVQLWDLDNGLPASQPFVGNSDAVMALAFSRDGKTLAAGTFGGSLTMWNSSGRPAYLDSLGGHAGSVNSVAYRPDGNLLVSGGGDDSILIWDPHTLLQIGVPLVGHTEAITSVTVSPDGKTLASGSRDKTIRLWNLDDRQPLGQPLTGHTGVVTCLAFSPDGKTLASGGEDNNILFWDMTTHRQIGSALTGHTWFVTGLAFSPDGTLLASASQDNLVILWDTATRQPVGQPLSGHTSWVSGVAFSPDGTLLASSGQDQVILIWDVKTRQRVGQPLAGFGALNGLAFSPDGNLLASANFNGSITLWDAGSWQVIGIPLESPGGPVRSLAFSPDGKVLAAGKRDTVLQLLKLDPQIWLDITCQRAGRNFTRAEWGQYFPDEPYRLTCPRWQAEPEPTATPAP